MSIVQVPQGFSIARSTPLFGRQSVPQALLRRHNTGPGVYGQVCVMTGTLKYFGFADADADEPEKTIVVAEGEFVVSPPQYWHRVELSADARFNINFWSSGPLAENG